MWGGFLALRPTLANESLHRSISVQHKWFLFCSKVYTRTLPFESSPTPCEGSTEKQLHAKRLPSASGFYSLSFRMKSSTRSTVYSYSTSFSFLINLSFSSACSTSSISILIILQKNTPTPQVFRLHHGCYSCCIPLYLRQCKGAPCRKILIATTFSLVWYHRKLEADLIELKYICIDALSLDIE